MLTGALRTKYHARFTPPGLLLLGLARLRAAGWSKLLKETIEVNRGWPVGKEITKADRACEEFHWMGYNASCCVTAPCDPGGGCLRPAIRAALEAGDRFCPRGPGAETSTESDVDGGFQVVDVAGIGRNFSVFSIGDQEVFSAMLSDSVAGGRRSHWLYPLNNMSRNNGPMIHLHGQSGVCSRDCAGWRDDGTILYHHSCIARLQNPSANDPDTLAFAKLVKLAEVGPADAAAAAAATDPASVPQFGPSPAFELGYDSLSQCAKTSAMGLMHLPWSAAALQKLLDDVENSGSCRQCAQAGAFDWDSYR